MLSRLYFNVILPRSLDSDSGFRNVLLVQLQFVGSSTAERKYNFRVLKSVRFADWICLPLHNPSEQRRDELRVKSSMNVGDTFFSNKISVYYATTS